jgi:hypothetical protein
MEQALLAKRFLSTERSFMANRDILAIGTSAGGVEALLFLAKKLPRDFPAAIVVTIHNGASLPASCKQKLSAAAPGRRSPRRGSGGRESMRKNSTGSGTPSVGSTT